jgi:hypothetical protein
VEFIAESVMAVSAKPSPQALGVKHFGKRQCETEADRMSAYKVMVDDNFHYGEEDERSEYGIYPTAEEAQEVCRRLVDASLLAEYRDGQTAEQLLGRYTSFGDDPFIVSLDGAPRVEFSAWTYARQRAQDFTATGEAGRVARERAAPH